MTGQAAGPDDGEAISGAGYTPVELMFSRAIGTDAVVVRGSDLVGIAWDRRPLESDANWTSFRLFAADADGAWFSVGNHPSAVDIRTGIARARVSVVSNPMRLARSGPSPVSHTPEVRAALREIVSAMCPRSVNAMLALGHHQGVVDDWIAPRGRCPDPGLLAFAEAHPWLVAHAARMVPRPGPEIMALGPDDAAAAVIALSGGSPDRGRETAARLRHLAGRRNPQREHPARHAHALLDLPAGMGPEPLPGPLPPSHPYHAETYAALWAAPEVMALARASGRDPRSVTGRMASWRELDAALAARTGLDGEWDSGTWRFPVAHMVLSFAREVVAPAMVRMGWDPSPRGAMPVHEECLADMEGQACGDAMRLLLGDRTLPALADVTARWHARATAISRAVAGAMGDAIPHGPLAFADVDLGDGLYLTNLTSAAELLAEGTDGPDGDGVPGLSHCVSSYAQPVAEGRTVIGSVRERLPGGGFRRLATAELAFWDDRPVHQLLGHGNSPVDGSLREVVERAASAIREKGLAIQQERRRKPPPSPDPAVVLAAPGAWEAVRDAWAFALPRPLRGLDAAGLLAAHRGGGRADG